MIVNGKMKITINLVKKNEFISVSFQEVSHEKELSTNSTKSIDKTIGRLKINAKIQINNMLIIANLDLHDLLSLSNRFFSSATSKKRSNDNPATVNT